MALHTNEMDRLGLYYDLQSRLESYLEQRGKLPILLAEIFTLKRQVPPTKLVVLSRPDLQGSSPLTQETHQLTSADRSPPDPVERCWKAPPTTLVGLAVTPLKAKSKRLKGFEGPDQPEPSLEAPVGLIAQVALSESTSASLTVNFQDARTSGQPWR